MQRSTRCSIICRTRALAAALVARFELQLLAELGFGLDLDQCAATGATADLVYVSPKSGRAVSRVAGEPWRDRMLRLPAFLMPNGRRRAGRAGRSADALRAHRLLPRAPCARSRAASRCMTRARASSMRCCAWIPGASLIAARSSAIRLASTARGSAPSCVYRGYSKHRRRDPAQSTCSGGRGRAIDLRCAKIGPVMHRPDARLICRSADQQGTQRLE